MARYNRRNPIAKTFKDYLVPMIGFALIIILLFSFFGGEKTPKNTISEENRTGINVSLNGEGSEAYVVYPGGDREEVTNLTSLYKGEKLIVKTGVASIEIPEVGNAELNKIGEIKFDEDGGLSLYSSDLWVNLSAPLKIKMQYGSVFAKEDAVFSVTQNEAASTVYMLKGISDVTNLAGKSVVLGKGQKITIPRADAAKDDVDLSIGRSELDDYFKSSEWYIRNNGDLFLNSIENTGTGTTDELSTATGSVAMNKSLITIEAPADESTVSAEKIIIKGSFSSDDINSITINGTAAEIDFENKTFEIKEFTLAGEENNLVYKAFNGANKLMEKSVSTVYYKGAPAAAKFQVENFSLDASKFTFVQPTSNPYTTTTDLVTIQGYVPPGIVSKITVNGFQLSSLTPYGSYWRYHANAEFGNLKEGLNIYKVVYFGRESEVLHTNTFSIVKKAPEVEAPEEIISDEASIEA